MITKRQQEICSCIDKCNIVADVGCDHGKIGGHLLKSGIAQRVIFCDISYKSLSKAKKFIDENNLYGAEFICQDGLKDIIADVAIIAGMGGHEILKIIAEAEHKPEKLIIQPMSDCVEVRKKLSKDYKFIKDYLIFDGNKYYNIMSLIKGSDIFTEKELEFGRTNIHSPSEDFMRYLKREYERYLNVLTKTSDYEVVQKMQRIKELL